MTNADLVAEGLIVTGDPAQPVLEDGAVVVRGSKILAVTSRSRASVDFSAARRIGGPHHLVHPGLIDCHQHASQALVKSLIAHELPMIYRLYIPAESAMTLDDVRLSATLLQAQLICSGVTTFAETTVDQSHEEPIIEAVQRVGMRCSIARGIGDQEFHHASLYSQVHDRSWARRHDGETSRDLERTADFLDRFDPAGSHQIKGAVAVPHLTRASDAYFRQAAELAEERGASLQIHVCRDREEVEFSLAVFGCLPIERLADLGVLSDRLLAIHAIMATDREIALLASAHAAVAHQPVECLNILNRIPPVRRMLDSGITVGLGCDNAINDGYEIMRAAWMIHTAVHGIAGYDPEHLPADLIFEMATSGGARALRWDSAIGSLEAGKQADFAVLDLDRPHLMPLQHPVVDLVRYGSRAEVTHVAVAGRLLLDDRELVTIDAEKMYSDARAAAPRIAAAVIPRRYRPLAPRIRWP